MQCLPVGPESHQPFNLRTVVYLSAEAAARRLDDYASSALLKSSLTARPWSSAAMLWAKDSPDEGLSVRMEGGTNDVVVATVWGSCPTVQKVDGGGPS